VQIFSETVKESEKQHRNMKFIEFLANVNSCSRSLCRRPSVSRLFVTFVHPTQVIEIFGNVSTPSGTEAIRWHPGKILGRSSQENVCVGG